MALRAAATGGRRGGSPRPPHGGRRLATERGSPPPASCRRGGACPPPPTHLWRYGRRWRAGRLRFSGSLVIRLRSSLRGPTPSRGRGRGPPRPSARPTGSGRRVQLERRMRPNRSGGRRAEAVTAAPAAREMRNRVRRSTQRAPRSGICAEATGARRPTAAAPAHAVPLRRTATDGTGGGRGGPASRGPPYRDAGGSRARPRANAGWRRSRPPRRPPRCRR